MNELETRLRNLQTDYPDPCAKFSSTTPAEATARRPPEDVPIGPTSVDVDDAPAQPRTGRRRRSLAIVAGAFVVFAGAVAIVATREAARTTLPAPTTGPGDPPAHVILHWKETRPGTDIRVEWWVATGPAHRLRSRKTSLDPAGAGPVRDNVKDDVNGLRQRYDTASGTITNLSPPDPPSTSEPVDDVSTLERALSLPPGTAANGTLDGRPVILLDRPGGLGYYIDPTSHSPLGEYLRDSSGEASLTVRYTGFEVLSATPANLSLFDLRSQYPDAWIVDTPRGIIATTVPLPVNFDRGGNDQAVQSPAFLKKAEAFAASHRDLMQRVGNASIGPDGTTSYPTLIQDRSAELNDALAACLLANGAEKRLLDGGGYSLGDPSGSAEKACAGRLHESGTYATSDEMHAGAAARALADAALSGCLLDAGLAPDPGNVAASIASSAGTPPGKACIERVNRQG